MIVTRVFLAAVGFTYLYLACWCSLMPVQTSQLVGFALKPGSGQSEFFVIYGGLELALAVIFLFPLIRSKQTENSLLVCLIVHACIVFFRSVSFCLYTDIQSMTFRLAFYEWLIFIGTAALAWAESVFVVEEHRIRIRPLPDSRPRE